MSGAFSVGLGLADSLISRDYRLREAAVAIRGGK
jgi:hypothetical protein